MIDFVLHPRLAADTWHIADWTLSRLMLINDARYPWLILVPRRVDCVELHDLPSNERAELIEEIARASAALKEVTAAAKINIGALGNLVPQLHIHVVARSPDDEGWPGPVWGNGYPVPYEAAARDGLLARLSTRLA